MSYELSALGYPYDALEPSMDKQTVHLHHDKHHAAYIDKLNALLAGKMTDRPLENLVINVDSLVGDDGFRAGVRFNAGGHYNHDMFWKILSPGGAHSPSGVLLSAIEHSFGNFSNFQEEFEKSALGHLGSGWTWLCVSPDKRDELFVCSTLNHDNPLMLNCTKHAGYPVLLLDLWEHAYYLKYNNRKADYIKAYWQIVNWDVVAERFENNTK